jgi:hypothetical protein
MFELWVAALNLADNQLPALGVVDVGGMHPHCQNQAERVYQQMPLASIDPLGAVIAADPPFSVVRTD